MTLNNDILYNVVCIVCPFSRDNRQWSGVLALKLDVRELRQTPGAEAEFNFQEEWSKLETGQGAAKFTTPVAFSGKVTNLGNSFLAKGVVTAEFELRCSRCLDTFAYAVKMSYLEEFCRQAKLDDTRQECTLFAGEEIEFDSSVKENFILELPMKWLCREECQGICSICGQDLNVVQCGCEMEEVDPRMEALKKFFDKE